MNIDEIKEGKTVVITKCDDLRLLENGFVPGTKLQIYRKVYGIISVTIRGTIIALRKDEYEKITVE